MVSQRLWKISQNDYTDPVVDTHLDPRQTEGTTNVDMTDDHDEDVIHQATLRTMTTIGLTNVRIEIFTNGKVTTE